MKGIAALLLAAALPALGQGYPSRTVTIVVPFPPGGGTDTGARLLATRLALRWGQPVLVENKPGAAGMVGVEYVSKVKPDGYTLIMGNFGTQSVNPTLYAKKLAYNPDTAFTAVTLVADLPLVLVVNPSMRAQGAVDLATWIHLSPPSSRPAGTSGAGGCARLQSPASRARPCCLKCRRSPTRCCRDSTPARGSASSRRPAHPRR